jgi:hypothetical protein
MAKLIIIAAIIIGTVTIIVLLKSIMLKEKDEAIPLFNCSIGNKKIGSSTSNSGDVYDCVETNGKLKRLDLKLKDE